MSTPTHDLKTRMYLNGNFVDITDKTFVRDPMVITRVRPDEASETPPQTCTATLNNEDLRFSIRNPMGTYYGYLQQNVPFEVMYRLVTDTFTRTVVNGMGSTDTGQAWTAFGLGGSVVAADFQVNGSACTMSVPATTAYRAGRLPGASYKNVDVQCDVSLAITDITGGPVEPGNIMLRMQSSTTYYMLRATITAAEAITFQIYSVVAGVETLLTPLATLPITHTSSQTLRFRMQAEGETIRAKVWATTASEPLDWQLEVHDDTITAAGFVGIRNGVSGTNTNALPIVFTVDNFSASSMRFFGEVSEFPTSSDVSDSDRYCAIEASGIMRRLSQGKSPLQSAPRKFIPTDGEGQAEVQFYWPLEDGPLTTTAAASIGNGTLLLSVADQAQRVFGQGDLAPWLAPTAQLQGLGTFSTIPDIVMTDFVAADGFMLDFVRAEGMQQDTALQFLYGATAELSVTWDVSTTTLILDDGTVTTNIVNPAIFGGDLHHYRFKVYEDSGTAAWDLYIDGVFLTGGTPSDLMGDLFYVLFSNSANNPWSIGHVAIYNGTFTPSDFGAWDAAFGFRGEAAGRRMQRLCQENGINFTYIGDLDDTPAMGPQPVATLLELLQQCAATDMGTLYESKGMLGLVYRTRASMYAQTTALTLDAGNEEVRHPFQPREDDRYTVNDVIAVQQFGVEYRAEQTTGPKSVEDPPSGVGRYDIRYDASLESATDLPGIAEWRLTLGTVDEPRFPDLGVDLDAPNASQHKQNVLDLDADDLIVVENATGVGIYDDIRQLVRGYSETWTGHRFTYAINASPASPYDVLELDGDYRLDSGSSVLDKALDTTATEIDVFTSDAFDSWASTADNPGEFPFDIIIGGERMTVSAITSATPTFVAAGTAAHADNASVVPGLPAGLAAGDALFLLAAIRNTGTGVPVAPAGYGALAAIGSLWLFMKYASASEAAPTVTFTGGVAGATCSAQLAAFRGVSINRANANGASNASAQNIAVTSLTLPIPSAKHLVLHLGWKQDDWTSVATLTNSVEVGEPSSTLGSDQGIVWDYRIVQGLDTVPTDTFVVTGGGAAISIGIINAQYTKQTFTVTRSVNGVVKSHASGAEVHVFNPFRLGL